MTPTTPPGWYEEQLSKNDSSLCFWWRISKNVWKIWSSWRWVCFWRTARHLDWLWLRKLFWQDPFASPPRPRASSHFIHSPSPLCPRGAPPPRGWAGPIDGWSSLPNPRGTRPGERTGLHLLRQPGLQWVRSFFCYQSSHAQTTLKTRLHPHHEEVDWQENFCFRKTDSLDDDTPIDTCVVHPLMIFSALDTRELNWKGWPFVKRVSSPKEATLLFFGFARTTVDGRRLLGLLMEDARLMEEDAFGKNCLMMGKLGHFGLWWSGTWDFGKLRLDLTVLGSWRNILWPLAPQETRCSFSTFPILFSPPLSLWFCDADRNAIYWQSWL